MKKDLTDVCDYLKGLVIPHTPEGFVIAEPFRRDLPNDELIRGISAFRSFLYRLYDRIAADKEAAAHPKGKSYDALSGNDSIRDCFPLFNDLAVVLFSLGIYGQLKTKPKNELTVHGSDLFIPFIAGKPSAMKKLSSKRLWALFDFLSDMGFYFEDLTQAGTFYVTYENDDDLILGLKLMAEALGNVKAGFLKLATVFMRGDFYPLAHPSPKDHMASAGEFAHAQPPSIKNWIVDLENHLLKNGCFISCFSLSSTNGSGSFSYASRKSKKTVCGIQMGITGCQISICGNHFSNENNILSELPEDMLDIIRTKRSTCGKMHEPNFKCKHGGHFIFKHNHEAYEICKWGGFSFALAHDSPLALFEKWIDRELAWSR